MEIATEINAAQSTERTKPLRQSGSVAKPLRKPTETSTTSGDDLEKTEDTDEDGVTDATDPVNICHGQLKEILGSCIFRGSLVYLLDRTSSLPSSVLRGFIG